MRCIGFCIAVGTCLTLMTAVSAEDRSPAASQPGTPASPARTDSASEEDPFATGAREAAAKDPFWKERRPASRPATRPVEPPRKPVEVKKEPATRPAEAPVRLSARDKALAEKLIKFFLETFGKHLESRDWITRTMAVISLSRIDDPRIADRLISVAKKDRNDHVRVFAWEAVHARNPSLAKDQRERWIAAGGALARKNCFRGDLRVGLVRALGSCSPTPDRRAAFLAVFENANLLSVADQELLGAMREVVAAWRSRELINSLVHEMNDIDNAYRAEFLLSGLKAPVPQGSELERRSTQKESVYKGKRWVTYSREGSEAAWKRVRGAWVKWLRQSGIEGLSATEPAPYMGRSRLIPRARRLTDPKDPKWRKELEIPEFRMAPFDINFVLDSTGSMQMTIHWIKTDLARMMRALKLVSSKPRMAVTLYRDYAPHLRKEDQLVVLSPDAAGTDRRGSWRDYVVKMTPMMSDADRLTKAILNAQARGGGDTPEAVYEALWVALKKQKWLSARGSRKIIVLVGDAPPHAETMDKIKHLVTSSAKRGFSFLCVKVSEGYRKAAISQTYAGQPCDLEASFDLIAKWGGGQAIALAEARGAYARYYRHPAASYHPQAAGASRKDPHQEIIGCVLRSLLLEAYHDRVDPFVRVLLELVASSEPERRQVIAPYLSRLPVPKPRPRPRPRPTPRPRPRPTPRPRPSPKIGYVYYLVQKTLARVTFNFTANRALSGMAYVDYQGGYTWMSRPADDIMKKGRKITDQRAKEIMKALATGKDPFKN